MSEIRISPEPCAKHELIFCASCKPKPTAAASPPATGFRGVASNHRIAEFDSTCPACQEDILANVDAIIYDEFHQAWVHQACPD